MRGQYKCGGKLRHNGKIFVHYFGKQRSNDTKKKYQHIAK